MSLLLLFGGAAAAPVGVNVALVLNDLLAPLHAQEFASLVFWTQDELYEFADEAAKRLARGAGVFVERDASEAMVDGTATYNAPSRHISTIHASAGTRALRPTTVPELDARDSSWPTTNAGTTDPLPTRFLHELGTETYRLYPIPDDGVSGNVGLVFHRFPATVNSGAAVVRAPAVMREWFTFTVLADALRKESKGAMPEVAVWFDQITALYEKTAREYWGGSL